MTPARELTFDTVMPRLIMFFEDATEQYHAFIWSRDTQRFIWRENCSLLGDPIKETIEHHESLTLHPTLVINGLHDDELIDNPLLNGFRRWLKTVSIEV